MNQNTREELKKSVKYLRIKVHLKSTVDQIVREFSNETLLRDCYWLFLNSSHVQWLIWGPELVLRSKLAVYLGKSPIWAQSNGPRNLSKCSFFNLPLFLFLAQEANPSHKRFGNLYFQNIFNFGNHFQTGQFIFLEIYLEIFFGNNLEIKIWKSFIFSTG